MSADERQVGKSILALSYSSYGSLEAAEVVARHCYPKPATGDVEAKIKQAFESRVN